MTVRTEIRLILLTAALALVCLHGCDPSTYPFYPACPLYRYTGLLCPGCGVTRALAALTHGQVAEALHQNLLLVFLLPAALFYLALALYRNGWPRIPHGVTTVLLFMALGFAVARNFVES